MMPPLRWKLSPDNSQRAVFRSDAGLAAYGGEANRAVINPLQWRDALPPLPRPDKPVLSWLVVAGYSCDDCA